MRPNRPTRGVTLAAAIVCGFLTGCGESPPAVQEERAAPQRGASAKLQQCAEGVVALSEITWELQQTERYEPGPGGTGTVLVRENVPARARLEDESAALAARLGMSSGDQFAARSLVAPAQAGAALVRGPMQVAGNEAFLEDQCARALVEYGGITQSELRAHEDAKKASAPSARPARSIPANPPLASTPEERACSERLRALYVRFLDQEITLEQLRGGAANPVDQQILNDALDALEAGEISNADVSVLREMGCIEAY